MDSDASVAKRSEMTAVVEIRCPACGDPDAVVKVAVGRYRCEDCDREFAVTDLTDRLG